MQSMANQCTRRIRIQVYQYSTQTKLLSPPQLKVDLFCCYFNQSRFAEFFQQTFFTYSFFHLFVLFGLCFIDFNSILLLLSCQNNTQAKV